MRLVPLLCNPEPRCIINGSLHLLCNPEPRGGGKTQVESGLTLPYPPTHLPTHLPTYLSTTSLRPTAQELLLLLPSKKQWWRGALAAITRRTDGFFPELMRTLFEQVGA